MRSTIIMAIVALMVLVHCGCESGSTRFARVKKIDAAKNYEAPPKQTSATPTPVYDYKHTIQKGEIEESPIGEGRQPLKHRIAVARFGDLKQPWRSPFDSARPGAVSGQDSTKVQASEDGMVLERNIQAQTAFEAEPCPAFTGLLTDKLVDDGRFIVVERKEINKLLREQEFGASGRVMPQTAASFRYVQGVSLIITGEVATLPARQEGQAASTLVLLRIYDVETAEIIASTRVEAPAVHLAVEQAAEQIADMVGQAPWRAKVSKVKREHIVFLNCGREDGVYPRDRFQIISLGEEILDPDEGTVLGVEESPIAVVEVVKVDERYCTARTLIKRRVPYRRGDLAEYIPGPYSNDLSDYEDRLSPSDDGEGSYRPSPGRVDLDSMDPGRGEPATGAENVDDRGFFDKVLGGGGSEEPLESAPEAGTEK